jgi:hypothetical protein
VGFIFTAILIISTQAAASTTLTDYDNIGEGYCQDSTGNRFTTAESQLVPYTTEAASNEYCASWCGQNTPSNYIGMDVERVRDNLGVLINFVCRCDFEIDNPSDDNAYFTYNYDPALAYINFYYGKMANKPYQTSLGTTDRQCFIWKTTTSGTSYPTKAPTVPKTVTIVDFEKLSTHGFCYDSTAHPFTGMESHTRNYTTFTEAENYCVSWCGQ